MSIALVNQTPLHIAGGGSATQNVTIPTPAAGNALALLVGDLANPHHVVSVSGCGATWEKILSVNDSSSTVTAELWIGQNCSGAAGPVAITFDTVYTGGEDINVSEWSGLPASIASDPSTGLGNTGTSATATTSTITPAAGKNAVLLAVGSCVVGPLTNAPSGGWTALSEPSSGSSGKVGFGYLLQASTAGSYSTTFALNKSYDKWATIICCLEAASGAAPKIPPPLLARPLLQAF